MSPRGRLGSRESDSRDWPESSRGSDHRSYTLRVTIASRISCSRKLERAAGNERRSTLAHRAGSLTHDRDPDTGPESVFHVKPEGYVGRS